MISSQSSKKSITVIGGGPSGMIAAISAAKQGAKTVRIIEKNDILGRKLLATGNGRCNLTNLNCEDAIETICFFADLGLLTRVEDEGRVYPYSEQAASVQGILSDALRHFDAEILCGREVESIERKDTGFKILIKGYDAVKTDSLIIASGGKAGPQYGSTGDGYRWAKALGHTIIRPMPSLVRLVSESSYFHLLKGIRAKGSTELIRMNKVVDRETGEIQFTEDGLSGICIFNLSRHYEKGDMIRIDLFPDYDKEALKELLIKRMKTLGDRNIRELLNGLLNRKMIPVILDGNGLDGERRAETLNQEEILKTVNFLKEWNISITGTRGWKEAQVTSGGIDLAEIDSVTMESKLVRGLYFAGELIDVDEKCGGYNLQWAWSSGIKAGKYAAAAIGEL